MSSSMLGLSKPLAGIPGTEATASKGGYYYQDLVTALAWTKLNVSEELHVEIAEDYAIAAGSDAQITQVKRVGGSLTLTRAVDHLERFLAIAAGNQGRSLSFVYLTTSDIGQEKEAKYRPAGKCGILYWQEVQAGADPSPLVVVLKKLAPVGSKLGKFLKTKSNAEIVHELVKKVSWAVRAPESDVVKEELRERVAQIAFEESGLEKVYGRRLSHAVVDAVTQASQNVAELARILTYHSLRTLIRDESAVVLSRHELAQLLDAVEQAKNLPLAPVNDHIRRRLDQLRESRFLPEAEVIDTATALGEDLVDGGAYRVGEKQLRAVALCWCARVLAEEHAERAEVYLENAARLAELPELDYIRALLMAGRDRAAALRVIAADHSVEAETIRYAIARKGNVDNGVQWLATVGLVPKQFDDSGQALILLDLLVTERWKEAVEWLERIPTSSFEKFPVLMWAGAHTLVAWAAVEGAGRIALNGPPLFDEIQLRDDPAAMAARRRAVDLFRQFHAVAEGWALPETAQRSLEYALGLMLSDRESRTTAISEIARRWNESGESSRWLPLALRAGVDLNKERLVARIDAIASRYGALTPDDARARLALAFHMRPESWIDDWSRISVHLSDTFTPAFLQHMHIQGLIQSGRLEQAQIALAEATAIPTEARERLELEVRKPDARMIERYREAVEECATPGTLHNLIVALCKVDDLAGASEYALKLFEHARDHSNAEGYLNLLRRQDRWKDILVFLADNKFLLDQSASLARLYVDALVRAGRWQEARVVADTHADLGDTRTELDLRLSISSGRWEEVGLLLERAKADPEAGAGELIHFAHIAHNLGNVELAKQLARRAAATAGEDPTICWSAYMLAVQGNWERGPDVRRWFQIALDSADTHDSPVRKCTLSDLRDMVPKWRERTDALNKAISSGEMFLALAAGQVNRPLTSIIAGVAVANESEPDFRKISPIPAYAGVERAPGPRPGSIALDATAMLSLAQLDLLGATLDLFGAIYVPHSTGVWLFTEASHARFHQPGRITDAGHLLDAVARGNLKIADTSIAFSKLLADEVGTDLAQLFAACQADRDAGNSAFVIRSSPLHRTDSLLEELAHVGDRQPLLRSTLEVVRSLHRYGGIEDSRSEDALQYLRMHDQGWPEDALISPGTRLYLDELALVYLQSLDLLNLLADARFEIFVHAEVRSQALALRAAEDAGHKTADAIERVRQFFVDGQERGVVRTLSMPARRATGDVGEQPVEVTAAVLLDQMFQYEADIEAVIFDDRAVNKHSVFSYPSGASVVIRTTLDVIGWMRDFGLIDEKQRLRCLTTLRRSGYLFMPLDVAELRAAVVGSTVQDGELFESHAARAIRENLLLARASGFLQLPMEQAWFTQHVAQLAQAITQVWSCDGEDVEARVKAAWLFDLMRYDGFADRMLGPEDDRRWVIFEALAIRRLLMNFDVPEARRVDYNRWLDESYLTEMVHVRPKVFETLCDLVRRDLSNLASVVDAQDKDGGLGGLPRKAVVGQLSKDFINNLPQSLRDTIFEDDAIFGQLGLTRSTIMGVGIEGSPSFSTEDLYAAAAAAYADGKIIHVEDKSKTVWSLTISEDGMAVCVDDKGRRFPVPHSPLVSPEATVRLDHARKFAAEVGMAECHIARWLDEITKSPISTFRIPILERDFQNGPVWRMKHVTRLLDDGGIAVADLVPTNRSYYERLLPPWAGQGELASYATSLKVTEGYFDHPLSRLVWSAHSSTTPVDAIGSMSSEALKEEIPLALESIDLWSLVGLVEALAARPDAFTGILETTRLAIMHFHRLIGDDTRLALTSALISLVDSTVNGSGVFIDVPVYWRRLASVTQAALMERAALTSSVDLKALTDWSGGSFALFHCATLADLPRAPRWNGFMADAQQFRQEFIGRVLHALDRRSKDIDDAELQRVAFGEQESSLASLRMIFFSGLPGPLEGTLDAMQRLPAEFVDMMESLLAEEGQPLFRRVLAAAQLADMGHLPEPVIDALTAAVRELDRMDVATEGEGSLPIFCLRLSLAAAATRNETLTAAVMQLLLGQPGIPLSIRLYAAVTVCAAEADADKWAAEVGRVFARCTSMVQNRHEAEHLLFVLKAMCDVRSDLRSPATASCARLQALAAKL